MIENKLNESNIFEDNYLMVDFECPIKNQESCQDSRKSTRDSESIPDDQVDEKDGVVIDVQVYIRDIALKNPFVNHKPFTPQTIKPLLYNNFQDSTDPFEQELLRQFNKLYKKIPSKKVSVALCKVKLVHFNQKSHYGLARSVAPFKRGDIPENQLFHRNDFKNHPYLIETLAKFGVEFYVIVSKNGSTIPRVLQIDQEFIKMIKSTFKSIYNTCNANF